MSDFPKKFMTKLPADFKDAAESMTETELKAKMVEFEMGVSFTQKTLEEDPEVCQLKEQLKTASEGYKEDLGRLNAQIRYCCWILEQRGQAPTP